MPISTPHPAITAALDRLYDEINCFRGSVLDCLYDEVNALGGSVPDGDFIGQVRMDLLDQILEIIDKHRRRSMSDDARRARLAQSLRVDPGCVVRGVFPPSRDRTDVGPPMSVRRLPVSRLPKDGHRQPPDNEESPA
jgi:hypothetical protein